MRKLTARISAMIEAAADADQRRRAERIAAALDDGTDEALAALLPEDLPEALAEAERRDAEAEARERVAEVLAEAPRFSERWFEPMGGEVISYVRDPASGVPRRPTPEEIHRQLTRHADSDGSRPGFRDDLAHHSDLMSLAVPR